jgi:PHD/YefM family antitoxin component YafN of YafNO toxin-antitoxin module
MKEIAISEFRADCFALLRQIQQTRKPIRVMRFGKAIAEVVPVAAKAGAADWFGSMKNTIEIVGDIISPASDEDEWEVLR